LECVKSTHFQVADTALTLWKDTVFVYLSKQEKDYIWRKLFALLKENVEEHWNSTIVQMSEELQHHYEGLDSTYWQKLETEYQEKSAKFNKESQSNPQQSTQDGKNVDTAQNNQTQQVSLVHEFDQRQFDLLRQQKNMRRSGRWQQIRMIAEKKAPHTTLDNNQSNNGN